MAVKNRAAVVQQLRAQLAACRAQGAAAAGRTKEVELIRQLQQRIGSANWSNWQMLRWSFYDYVRLSNIAGASELNFFNVPAGQNEPNPPSGTTVTKTLEQTNVGKSRTFGQVYFIVMRILTHVFPLPNRRQLTNVALGGTGTNMVFNNYKNAMIAIADLLQLGTLQISIGQKQYFDIPQPFLTCPPGFGVQIDQWAAVGSGATAVAGNAAGAKTQLSYWPTQSIDESDVFACTPPQLIEPEQSIEAKITFDDAKAPDFTAVGQQVNSVIFQVDVGLILDGYIVRPSQ